jgi:HEAT repeat protein
MFAPTAEECNMTTASRAHAMRRIVALATLVIVASAAQAFPRLPPPADVNERIQAAIRGLSSDTDEQQVKAVVEIRKLAHWGDRAIPFLIERLRDSSPNLTCAIADALAAYGPAAKDALPLLTELVRQPRMNASIISSCSWAIAALGDPGNRDMIRVLLAVDYDGGRRVGPRASPIIMHYPTETLPVVADLLADPHRRVRARAAYHLFTFARAPAGKMSPVDLLPATVRSTVVAHLRSEIDSPEPQVRDNVVAALLGYDPDSIREVVPRYLTMIRRKENYGGAQEILARRGPDTARVLLDYLDDPDADVRREIARTIANTAGAAPVLSTGLRHPNPTVRAATVMAVSMNPSLGKQLRAGVIGRLADDNGQVRVTAAVALVDLGPTRAQAAIPALSEAALSRSPADRQRAFAAFQTMGVYAQPAVPTLSRCAHSSDLPTRFAAARALAVVDRTTWRIYVPVYIDVLTTEAAQRQSAIRLLTETGPDAKDALPVLRKLFKDESPAIQIQSAEAVARIAPNDCEDAIGRLAAIVSGDDAGTIRRHIRNAIRALQRIGTPAKFAVPALIERMRSDPDTDVTVPAAVAVILVDPENAKEAYDAFRAQLQPGLEDPDSDWLDGIANLGKAAKPLIPDLVAALNSKRSYQRMAAVEALTAIGPDAKDALPALRELEKSGTKSVEVSEIIRAIEAKKK